MPFIGFSPIRAISTHTLTWSVTRQEMKKPCMNLHFNSHAHVERDAVYLYDEWTFCISTHTLTWSVTLQFCAKCGRWWISTHTLTWSVTEEGDIIKDENGNFNSHAHVERDRLKRSQTDRHADFNSHAHVERDDYNEKWILFIKNFNSHAHVERD